MSLAPGVGHGVRPTGPSSICAYGSTLRLTLGCLLGLELRRVGSGTRLTFGAVGAATLSEWMHEHEHARVCWFPTSRPWLAEAEAIGRLDLPLNLDQNCSHPFHPTLTRLRADARAHARNDRSWSDTVLHGHAEELSLDPQMNRAGERCVNEESAS